jgi:hypothetical protein
MNMWIMLLDTYQTPTITKIHFYITTGLDMILVKYTIYLLYLFFNTIFLL